MTDELKGWLANRTTVRIELETAISIRDVASKYGLNVRADVRYCHSSAELTSWRYVYDEHGPISSGNRGAGVSEPTKLWLYVSEREGVRRNLRTGEMSVPGYDLHGDRKDVCVRVHARNMALEGFSSNEVVIDGRHF
jgi:hypothetical protein